MQVGECTLCRKCVGICRKTVGIEAINYNKKENGDAAIEFLLDKCIACGSCAYICDAGAVIIHDVGEKRIMITPSGRTEFELKKCGKCSDYWIPKKQLEYIAKKANVPVKTLELCIDCRD
jgi:ferredoxin